MMLVTTYVFGAPRLSTKMVRLMDPEHEIEKNSRISGANIIKATFINKEI